MMPNLPTMSPTVGWLLFWLCLVMLCQLLLMAHWARVIRKENASAIAGAKHLLHCWTGHGERHTEINRELAYQAGHIERIELAMCAFVQRMPALSVDETNLRDFFALGEPSELSALTKELPIDQEWERRMRAAAEHNSRIANWSSGLEPAPVTKKTRVGPNMPREPTSFTCKACGHASFILPESTTKCPLCGTPLN